MGIWEHHIYTLMKGTAPLSSYFHRPIYLLYVPLYAIGQLPSLLVLQSVIVGLGGWVFYRFCLIILVDPVNAVFLSLAYLLYFPNWYLCLYDFHSDHWFPLLFGMMYLIEIKDQDKQAGSSWCLHRLSSRKTAFLLFILTVLLFMAKEIMPFVLIVYFLTAYYRTNKQTYLYLFYFTALAIACAFFIFPYGVELQSVSPVIPKLFFFLCLLMPLCFLGLFSLSWFLPAAVPLIFVWLSPSSAYFSIGNQYPAVFVVPFLYAMVMTLKSVEDGRIHAKIYQPSVIMNRLCVLVFILTLAFHVLLAPSPLSRQFWLNSMHSEYHWSKFVPTERDWKIIEYLEKEFTPERYSVSVQNGIHFPPLGQQKHWTVFPDGIKECDRIVLDKTLESEFGDQVDSAAYKATLKIIRDQFQLVYELDGFEVWGKK